MVRREENISGLEKFYLVGVVVIRVLDKRPFGSIIYYSIWTTLAMRSMDHMRSKGIEVQK